MQAAGWEYRVMEGDALPSEGNLHELDREGWELVQIIDRGGYVYIYLRRPKAG